MGGKPCVFYLNLHLGYYEYRWALAVAEDRRRGGAAGEGPSGSRNGQEAAPWILRGDRPGAFQRKQIS